MLRFGEFKRGGIKLIEGACSSPQPDGRAQEAPRPAPDHLCATRHPPGGRAPITRRCGTGPSMNSRLPGSARLQGVGCSPSSAPDGWRSPVLHGMESGGRAAGPS